MSTVYSLRLGLKVLLKVHVCTRYRSCPGGKGVCEWLIWEVTPASVTWVMGRGEGEGKEASKACASRQLRSTPAGDLWEEGGSSGLGVSPPEAERTGYLCSPPIRH